MAKKLNTKVILFNAAAVLVMGSAAVVQARNWLFPPQIAACSERYLRTITFTLERSGALLSASDIQASTSGMDYGVLDNFTVKRLKNGPAPVAMGIEIKPGTQQANHDNGQPGGISFPWKPRALPADTSATCLSYSVFLPADFDFETGGTLPGVFGARPDELSEKPDRFEVRVEWVNEGQSQQFMMLSTKQGSGFFRSQPDVRTAIPRGEWVKIEQEIVLNDPGIQNAIVRYWVNGVLKSENKEAELRVAPDVTIVGVAAELYFGTQRTDGDFPAGRSKKTEQIWLSPFELRVK